MTSGGNRKPAKADRETGQREAGLSCRQSWSSAAVAADATVPAGAAVRCLPAPWRGRPGPRRRAVRSRRPFLRRAGPWRGRAGGRQARPRSAQGVRALRPVRPVDGAGTQAVVMAVQGVAFTLAIELALACDIVVAADDVRFRQLEVGRGILPFGGTTFRAPAQLGWGNAMRFLLTAEEFGADQALRIGLVQEIVPAGQQLQRATAIARAVAAQAPLGVQGTLANARAWRADAERGRRRAPARAAAGGTRKRGRR